jgi:hypothetical protein
MVKVRLILGLLLHKVLVEIVYMLINLQQIKQLMKHPFQEEIDLILGL